MANRCRKAAAGRFVHQSLPVGNGTVIRWHSATEGGNKMLPCHGVLKMILCNSEKDMRINTDSRSQFRDTWKDTARQQE
jgi:hypothetical protein